jgi:hypothetical protein
MTTIVVVTTEHIAKGEAESCERCPVALAIADAFPDLAYVAVGPEEITMQLGRRPEEIQIDTPGRVQDFIWDFDDGGAVEPFSFDVDLPAEVAA